MWLDQGPLFDNRFSWSNVLQLLEFGALAAVALSRTVWRSENDSTTLKKLAEAQQSASLTQANLTTTQANQQQLIERMEEEARNREARSDRQHEQARVALERLEQRHDERIRRLESRDSGRARHD